MDTQEQNESISKIKHVSLNLSKSQKLKQAHIVDDDIDLGSSQDMVSDSDQSLQSQKSNESFFEQTIQFKSRRNGVEKLAQFEDTSAQNTGVTFETVNVDTSDTNSMSHAFHSSHNFTKEVSRVFKKTIFTLILDCTVFASFVFVASNVLFFTFNPIISYTLLIGTLIASVATTAFYFLLLSDKQFLYANIGIKVVFFVVIQALIGQLFSLVTIMSAVLLCIFQLMAYAELEKMQLGSRLFNLTIIAGECRRILITLCIFIFCISTFNQIIYRGSNDKGVFIDSQNFVAATIFKSDTFVDTVLTGSSTVLPTPPLNAYFINRGLAVQNGFVTNTRSQNEFTFRSFLILTYDKPEIITEDEQEVYELQCKKDKVENCDEFIKSITDTRLIEFRNANYANYENLELTSRISRDTYRNLTRQYYLNMIGESAKDVNAKNTPLSFLSNIPLTNIFSARYLLPISLVVLLFIVLSVIRFIFNWLSSIVLFLLWHFMALIRFVRVDIENVESEVVSI